MEAANLLEHDESRLARSGYAQNFGGHYVDMGGDADYNSGGDSDIEAIERQFEAMENREGNNNNDNGNNGGGGDDITGWGRVLESMNVGMFGEDRGWNQFQVLYGDSLIPEESISLSGLMKSDFFYVNCYAFVVIAVSAVSLKIDWKRAQENMKNLQVWTIGNIILHSVIFLANYVAMALFTNYSSSIRYYSTLFLCVLFLFVLFQLLIHLFLTQKQKAFQDLCHCMQAVVFPLVWVVCLWVRNSPQNK